MKLNDHFGIQAPGNEKTSATAGPSFTVPVKKRPPQSAPPAVNPRDTFEKLVRQYGVSDGSDDLYRPSGNDGARFYGFGELAIGTKNEYLANPFTVGLTVVPE